MRRPPIVCRRAVQSLQPPVPQHIWISDELLSNTLHRFFRNSCPHQKRHGSHVPGPLEARRRAAKRRMTVSANFYPQESFAPSFNLGALFGFRSAPQPSWRYEPPSLQQDAEPLESAWHATAPVTTLQASEASTSSVEPSKSPPNATYSFSQSIPHVLGRQHTANQCGAKEEDIETTTAASKATPTMSVEEQSTAAVEAFKVRIAGATGLSRKERNKAIREAFLDCCSTSIDTSTYTISVIRHMVELGCDPTAVLQQHSTSCFVVPTIQSSEWSGFVGDLEMLMESFPHCVRYVHQIHRRIAETTLLVVANTSDPQSLIRELMLLVRQLWQSAHLQGAGLDESSIDLLRSVTNVIKDRFCRRSLAAMFSNITTLEHRIPAFIGKVEEDQSRLSAAVHVLSCVPKARLVKCIPTITFNIAKAATNDVAQRSKSQTPLRMHVWLQLLHHLDLERASPCTSLVDNAMASLTKYVYSRDGEGGRGIRVLLSALVTNAFRTCTMEHDYTPIISDLIISSGTTTGHSCSGSGSVDAVFDVFLSQLKKEHLPQEPLVQALLGLVARHAGLKSTIPFLQVLVHRRMTLADPASLHQLVANEMAANQSSSKVTEIERQQAAFALHICKTVSELLISLGSTPTTLVLRPQLDALQAQRQLAHILTRAQIDHALPLAYRDVAADLSVSDSVHLVHQLAHQYSTDASRTQREAWRATYYLFQYLQRNSLPIGPLFSKAIVRIAIIRPMSENRFISARRLIWIRHLVARVEGEAVAKQIEAGFWTWRGNLIQHAKTVYVAVGGHPHDKAHVGTMKKLGLI